MILKRIINKIKNKTPATWDHTIFNQEWWDRQLAKIKVLIKRSFRGLK